MAKKKVLEVGDRVERRGEKGTVVHVHEKVAVSVLPDTRPRSQGSVVWGQSECTPLPRATGCPRCGERHSIFYCPEGL